MAWLRYSLSILGGGGIAVVLFLGMRLLVSETPETASRSIGAPQLRFVEAPEPRPIETKERRLPPEPEKVTQPPEKPVANETNQRAPSFSSTPLALPQPELGGTFAPLGPGELAPTLEPRQASSPTDQSLAPLSTIPPEYPFEARLEGIEGFVTFELSIDASGAVTDAKVIEFSDRVFIRPAQRVIYRWRFQPLRLEGVPIASKTFYTMEFTLSDE